MCLKEFDFNSQIRHKVFGYSTNIILEKNLNNQIYQISNTIIGSRYLRLNSIFSELFCVWEQHILGTIYVIFLAVL